MTVMQKHAWFNLGVVALTLVTVLALLPLLGHRAAGGFGLLGLLGLDPFLFRRRSPSVVYDERDSLIQQRSARIGFATVWLVGVAACALTPTLYGESGAVPVSVVQISVFCGLIVLTGAMSVATLVQYGRTEPDGG